MEDKPVKFEQWIEEIRPTLQPPVANRLLYKEQIKVMVVGGPNLRKDFHLEDGEELFYQLKGDMRLDVMEREKLRQIVIKEGEIFLLPGRIPHSPQRFANTVGLVVERDRSPEEIDGLRWYVGDSDKILYEEYFHCTDLGVQLVPVIERFMSSEMYRSGQPNPDAKATYDFPVDHETVLRPPVSLRAWLDAHPAETTMFEGEFMVKVARRSTGAVPATHSKGEVFFFQLRGAAIVDITFADGGKREVKLDSGDVYLLQPNSTFAVMPQDDACETMMTQSKHFQ